MLKSPFLSRKSVVVSENTYASYGGLKVLEAGGNAVDAGVTVSLSIAVTLPHLGGVGGDFFALFYDASGDKVHFINGSGYAPSGLTIDYLRSKGFTSMPKTGIYSITIPGLVDALFKMWKNFGSMEWKALLQYPYKLANDGFPITYTFSNALAQNAAALLKEVGSGLTYPLSPVPKPGELIRYSNLARLLSILSEDPRSFYEGEVMEAMVEYLNGFDEIFKEEDFKNYSASIGDPIKTSFMNMDVYEMPPNTQGITTLHCLKLIEDGYPCDVKPHRWERIQYLLGVFKVAYEIRDKYVTDPNYMSISADELLSSEFIEEIKKRVAKAKGKSSILRSLLDSLRNYGPIGDTTYFAIVDRHGNVLSGIQSLFYAFGSCITEPKYGVTFNGRASSFSLNREHVNSLAPRKKPLHTLSTPILKSQRGIIAHGLSGGHFRPQLHTQILTNMLIHDMDPQTAIEFPRFVWDLETNKVTVEEGLEVDRSHPNLEVVKYGSRLGVAATVVVFENGTRGGYVDVRGEGLAIGEPL